MKDQYSSFVEIDKRLKILHLQREIYKESFKLDLKNAKTDLNPIQLLGNNLGLKQLLLDFAFKKGIEVLNKYRRKDFNQ